MSTNRKIQRILSQYPQFLTRNSYLNFLRFNKQQHPRLGLRKILQKGFEVWNNMNNKQRKQFEQKKTKKALRPRLKWPAQKRSKKITRRSSPNSSVKRKLTAKNNIQRRKRNRKSLQRYRPKKMPVYYE